MPAREKNDPLGSAGQSWETLIERALATPGGHLMIGRGGFTLWYARGCFCSGYASDEVKRLAIAKGLPVIDSRGAPFTAVASLVACGPIIAVGEEPDEPPYHALSRAPLALVAEAYRAAGAEVFNLSGTAPPALREGEEEQGIRDGR